MLPRARLRDHTLLSHAHGQQALPETVVDLVRAGMQQVFTLQIDARAAQMFGEPRGKLERRGTPREIVQERIQLRLKAVIRARLCIHALEFFERGHQRFRDVTAAIRPVAAALPHHVRRVTHPATFFRVPFAARIRLLIRTGSFLPGLASTPLQTSTAYGLAARIASPTFSGVNPPARKIGLPNFCASTARFQLNFSPVPPRASDE